MLIILFVYPVIGATIRLGILARERRLQINPIAATVPVEHADHGRWATGGLLVAVLLAVRKAGGSGLKFGSMISTGLRMQFASASL